MLASYYSCLESVSRFWLNILEASDELMSRHYIGDRRLWTNIVLEQVEMRLLEYQELRVPRSNFN